MRSSPQGREEGPFEVDAEYACAVRLSRRQLRDVPCGRHCGGGLTTYECRLVGEHPVVGERRSESRELLHRGAERVDARVTVHLQVHEPWDGDPAPARRQAERDHPTVGDGDVAGHEPAVLEEGGDAEPALGPRAANRPTCRRSLACVGSLERGTQPAAARHQEPGCFFGAHGRSGDDTSGLGSPPTCLERLPGPFWRRLGHGRHNPRGPISQLLIGRSHVDNEVPVRLAELDHHSG